MKDTLSTWQRRRLVRFIIQFYPEAEADLGMGQNYDLVPLALVCAYQRGMSPLESLYFLRQSIGLDPKTVRAGFATIAQKIGLGVTLADEPYGRN